MDDAAIAFVVTSLERVITHIARKLNIQEEIQPSPDHKEKHGFVLIPRDQEHKRKRRNTL